MTVARPESPNQPSATLQMLRALTDLGLELPGFAARVALASKLSHEASGLTAELSVTSLQMADALADGAVTIKAAVDKVAAIAARSAAADAVAAMLDHARANAWARAWAIPAAVGDRGWQTMLQPLFEARTAELVAAGDHLEGVDSNDAAARAPRKARDAWSALLAAHEALTVLFDLAEWLRFNRLLELPLGMHGEVDSEDFVWRHPELLTFDPIRAHDRRHPAIELLANVHAGGEPALVIWSEIAALRAAAPERFVRISPQPTDEAPRGKVGSALIY